MTHANLAVVASEIKKQTDTLMQAAEQNQERLLPLRDGQKPPCVELDCIDSRIVHGERSVTPGKCFSPRTIGNYVDPSDKSSFAALIYPIRHAGSKFAHMKGHTGCGAIAASMGDCSTLDPELKATLEAIKADYTAVVHDPQLDHLSDVAQNEFKNIQAQALKVVSYFKNEVESGQLTVIASMHDLQGNFGQPGNTYYYSVNGNTDPEFVRNHPSMAELKGEEYDHLFTAWRA